MALRNPEGPVLVAWASRGGQTATLAQRVAEVLAKEHRVELLRVNEVDWEHLTRWSALVFGSPTYGAGDLHPDWDQPERRLRDLDLSGFPAAAFGCGNPRYVTAWWAVDILENRLKNGGARVVVPSYRADTMEGLRVRDADPWVDALSSRLADY